jgi:PAS domain S-box-containing protein
MEISHRIAREAQLRLLESVVISTNDAVLITEAEPIDEPGPRIVYVNPAFTRMTGYTLEEVLGKTPRILQGEKTDRTALEQIRTALQNWQSARCRSLQKPARICSTDVRHRRSRYRTLSTFG